MAVLSSVPARCVGSHRFLITKGTSFYQSFAWILESPCLESVCQCGSGCFLNSFSCWNTCQWFFLFFKNYFWHQHIKIIQKVQTAINFSKKKKKFWNLVPSVLLIPPRGNPRILSRIMPNCYAPNQSTGLSAFIIKHLSSQNLERLTEIYISDPALMITKTII
jgi:hypothetical protein